MPENKFIQIISIEELSQHFENKQVKPVKDCLCYSERWIKVLEQTYDFEFKAALNIDTGFYIVFAIINNSLGKKLVSLPFSDYIEYKYVEVAREKEILDFLEDSFPEFTLHIKTNLAEENKSLGNPVKSAVYHCIPVEGKASAKELQSGSFKRGVSKAKKTGVKIDMSSSLNSLEEFYEIHAHYRINKFGKAPQPYDFFDNLYKQFFKDDQGFILRARFEGKTIAAIFILKHNKDLVYKFGCSKQEYFHLRPNNLLFSYLTDYAIGKKIKNIDLGLSGKGRDYEGLRRFKSAMGGKQFHISYYERNSGNYPHRESQNFKFFLDSMSRCILEQKDIDKIKKMSSIIYPFYA